MHDILFSTNNNENTQEITTDKGLFFNDGIRQIDFVLSYQRVNDNKRNRKIRFNFLKVLLKRGLEIEIQDEEGNLFSLENFDYCDNFGEIVFIKLFAQWETLCHYAEFLRIRKPMLHPPSNCKYKQSLSFQKYFRKFDIFNSFQARTHVFTMPFSSSKEYLFDIPDNKQNFFTQSERSLIVNYILRSITFQCNRKECIILADFTHQRSTSSSMNDMEMCTICAINSESECSKSHSNSDENDEGQTDVLHLSQTSHKLTDMSLHNLISEKVFENAYCLHEGSIIENSLRKRKESERIKLYQCWGSLRNIFRPQPLDRIRSYYGEKIAFYFCWLGYYTYWLFFPSLLGVIITLFNIFHATSDTIVKDIKEGGNITMCPLLCNSKQCKFWKLSDVYYKFFVIRILDNKTMIIMAFSMSIWAFFFLEMWKREQFRLAFHWNVHDLQNQYEPQKPEFVAFIAKNQINEENETTVVPFWRRTVPFLFFKYSTVLFSIILALAFLVGIILYEIVIYALLMMHPSSLVSQMSSIIISVTGSIISLVVILILAMVYAKLAHWLTDLENNETQSKYDDSVTVKLYLLEFINNYSYLFYFGFILPLIQPIPIFKAASDFKPIGCPTGGCLFGLSVQLAFIMIGRQLVSHFAEYGYPVCTGYHKACAVYTNQILLCSSIKRYKLQKSKKVVKYQRKNLENVKTELIRCYADLILTDLPPQPVFYEYLEMLIQFGFITMFIPAFPLAPVLALINNLFEIRNDATKFLIAYKRPVAQRVKDIGIWINILSVVAGLAVKSNAILIAFTTFFIERLLYIWKYSPTGDLKGFSDFTLSYLKSSEFPSPTNETYCRYMDFRHHPLDIKNVPLTLTSIYWEILAAKVIFIYLFENLVYLIMKIISVMIPDVNEMFTREITKEVAITRKLLLK